MLVDAALHLAEHREDWGRHALAIGVPIDAIDDVLQDMAERLLKAKPEVRDIRSYLNRTLYSARAAYFRRERRHIEHRADLVEDIDRPQASAEMTALAHIACRAAVAKARPSEERALQHLLVDEAVTRNDQIYLCRFRKRARGEAI